VCIHKQGVYSPDKAMWFIAGIDCCTRMRVFLLQSISATDATTATRFLSATPVLMYSLKDCAMSFTTQDIGPISEARA
jgi:hypothetical protein